MNEFDKLLILLRDAGEDYVLKDCYHSGAGLSYREVCFSLMDAVQTRESGLLTLFYLGERVGQDMTAEDAMRIWRERYAT